jgi:hypothetical protein
MSEQQYFPVRGERRDLAGFVADLIGGQPVSIWLEGESWGPAECAIIAGLGPDLDTLSLRGTKIADRGLEALTAGPALTTLRRLFIERSGISDRGLEALIRATRFDRLQELTLCNRAGVETGSSNLIGDAGAVALASTPNLPALRELNLWRTAVGDTGFEAIAKSSRQPELASVYAWETRLSEDGSKRIKDIASGKANARQAAGLTPFRWINFRTDWDPKQSSWTDDYG